MWPTQQQYNLSNDGFRDHSNTSLGVIKSENFFDQMNNQELLTKTCIMNLVETTQGYANYPDWAVVYLLVGRVVSQGTQSGIRSVCHWTIF